MKRAIIFVCLVFLSILSGSPAQAGSGQDCQGQQDGSSCGGTRKISAQEMGAVGSGAAVLLGVAGYLVLRRRKSV